jgi:hypothetical protein
VRRALLTPWFVGGALGLAILLGALDAGRAADPNERAAVLKVVREGQAAILGDSPATVCRLLTRRARLNSLISISLDHDPRGRMRPTPKTCAQAIGYEIDDARTIGELKRLRADRSLRETRIVRIRGNRAHVRKGDAGNTSEIYLLKRKDGWRADYATFSPFDGTSGE